MPDFGGGVRARCKTLRPLGAAMLAAAATACALLETRPEWNVAGSWVGALPAGSYLADTLGLDLRAATGDSLAGVYRIALAGQASAEGPGPWQGAAVGRRVGRDSLEVRFGVYPGEGRRPPCEVRCGPANVVYAGRVAADGRTLRLTELSTVSRPVFILARP